jgi:hypothetical protein
MHESVLSFIRRFVSLQDLTLFSFRVAASMSVAMARNCDSMAYCCAKTVSEPFSRAVNRNKDLMFKTMRMQEEVTPFSGKEKTIFVNEDETGIYPYRQQ